MSGTRTYVGSKKRSTPGRWRCGGCAAHRQTSKVQLTVKWPGGGVRLAEVHLCGACTFALLDIVDSGAMKVAVQVPLPGYDP